MFWISAAFLSVFATVLACMEIETEGKYGWAEKAPTWYWVKGWVPWLYGKSMNGMPLTGYHLFMTIFIAMVFHYPFVNGAEWSIAKEIYTMFALIPAWSTMWDYHWFVLNPAYKGRFREGQIWWHREWWFGGRVPKNYPVSVAMSIAVAAFGGWLEGAGSTMFLNHLVMLICFTVWTALVHIFAPRYQTWYEKMRTHDERDLAGIFHHNNPNDD